MTPYHFSLSPEFISGSDLDQYLALGWFRMHQNIFTISHLHLDKPHQVHWLRYVLAEIENKSSHQRIRNRAKNFRYTFEDCVIRDEHKELHRKYRASINFDGAWSIEECLFGDEPVNDSIYNTKCISIYDQDKLIAAGYFDLGASTAASILNFFDPSYRQYSLGKYLILLTVDYLKANDFELYYPGYLVESVSKMDYKLFLGEQDAQYFDPEIVAWRYFPQSPFFAMISARYHSN